MKSKLLVFIIFQIIWRTSFSQSDSLLMRQWNLEMARIGDQMKTEIDSSIKEKPVRKSLTSSQYKSGELLIYRQHDQIAKLSKLYSNYSLHQDDYYFSGRWPVYVELKNISDKTSDRFYFDKTNLMLWITTDQKHLTVSNKECADRWFQLLEQIDKLNLITKMKNNLINEDAVKLPEPPPLSKEDSIQLKQIKEEFEKLMENDSLKK